MHCDQDFFLVYMYLIDSHVFLEGLGWVELEATYLLLYTSFDTCKDTWFEKREDACKEDCF